MGSSRSTTEQKATIPAWAEAAARDVLSRAKDVSRIPYAPYYGPDVAAMTPMQVAAMQGTNQMAAAFGSPTVDVTAGMPTAQNYDGMMAYSAAPMYEAALAELERRQPGTFAALRAPFIDPITGAGGGRSASYSAPAAVPSPYVPTLAPTMPAERGGREMEYGGGRSEGRSTTSMATLGSYMPGGVNTRNPASLSNRVAAAATSRPQGAPTQSDRPVSRSSASGGGSGGMGGGK